MFLTQTRFSFQHDMVTYFGPHKVKLRNAVPVQDLWWYTLRDSYLASRPGSVVYIKKKGYLCVQCTVSPDFFTSTIVCPWLKFRLSPRCLQIADPVPLTYSPPCWLKAQNKISQGKFTWNTPLRPGIEPGPWRGSTVRYVQSPTELS